MDQDTPTYLDFKWKEINTHQFMRLLDKNCNVFMLGFSQSYHQSGVLMSMLKCQVCGLCHSGMLAFSLLPLAPEDFMT